MEIFRKGTDQRFNSIYSLEISCDSKRPLGFTWGLATQIFNPELPGSRVGYKCEVSLNLSVLLLL